MQPLSGYAPFHLPAKVDPHPLLISCWRAGRDFLPVWISCILCNPFLSGLLSLSVAPRWHLCTCVQFKNNKCSLCFQDDSQFIFCGKAVLCTYKKFSGWCCYILLAQSAFAGGCPQLKSVSLSAYILASISFHSRWGSLSCFWEAPEWVPCDLDLLIWERLLDFACIL